MKINCPNCSTQFSVPEAALGESGKTLKCARCGNRWFQTPTSEDTAPVEPLPDIEDEAGFPVDDDAGAGAGDGDDAPVGAAGDDDDDDDEAGFQARLDDDAPERPEFADLADDTDDSADDADKDADAPASDTAGAAASPPAGGPSPPPPPAGRGSPLDDGGDFLDFEDEDQEERAAQAAAAESADDDRPEPIAYKLPRAADGDSAARGGAGVLWGMAVVLLLSGLAGAAYLYRMPVVAALPQALPLYEALGVEARPLGAGLAIRNVKPERRRTPDGEILVLRGIVANTTHEVQRMPRLKVSVLRGSQLAQRKVVNPPLTELGGGETVSFQITVEAADPLADRVTVSFEPHETPPAS